jgi:biopolymer transport protein ExbD
MKMGSPLPHKKARIEIIPLIDIMFFLLASFMMVSLTMIKMQAIKMDLPTATQAQPQFKPELINIQVDKLGDIYIEKERRTTAELFGYLTNKVNANTNIPVYISGDKEATHGAVISVLDLVRKAGIQKVSFAITVPADRSR